MQHRSISQRLSKAKSPEAKALIMADWAKDWEIETLRLFKQLERAIQGMDYDQLCIATGQLKAVARKHFDALPRVLGIASGENNGASSVAPEKAEPMQDGYITAREWAKRNGREPRQGQKILTDRPGIIPAAKKVRNPRGGVPIWAVPEDTIWPF